MIQDTEKGSQNLALCFQIKSWTLLIATKYMLLYSS